MRTAKKQNQPQQKSSGNLTKSNALAHAASHDAHRLHFQRAIGNQAVRRLLQGRTDGLEAASHAEGGPTNEGRSETSTTKRFAHDFSRIPLQAPAPITIQPKPAVNTPGDIYEQEADHLAEQVMRMPEAQSPQHQHLQTRQVSSSDARQTTAAPIVNELLTSPGETLDSATRSFMEPRFGHDFSRIRIHTDAAAARASEALGAEAFTVGHHIAFARERFIPGAADSKRLVAHELAHTIQQAATSPHIAMQPDKNRAAPTPGSLKIVGGVLGWNSANTRVRVKREVGGTQGYDDRLQAIAVARLAKADPAGVVQDMTKRWHAVEITSDFEAGPDRSAPAAMDASASESSPFLAVYGLPSLARIDESRAIVKELKATWARLDNQEQQWRNDPEYRKALRGAEPPITVEMFEDAKEQALRDLSKANRTYAARLLGVTESEIESISSLSSRKAGKINIMGLPAKGSPGAGHAPLGGETEFKEGLASAFWIDFPELDKPRVAETMFHESSHLRDWELAQEWIRKYKTETKREFVKSAPGAFKDWLKDQVKQGHLSKADSEMVSMEAADATRYTEARANVRSFLADLQAGAPDLATNALVGYARALKPGGQYGNPVENSEVKAALVVELKTAYRQMPEPMQRQYDAAVTAARKENPSAWISELDFSKSAGK